MSERSDSSPDPAAAPDGWLVVIDAQQIFASPATSPWGSPMFGGVVDRIGDLCAAYGHRVVFTRFVADPGLGGSWGSYYDDWPFALVPDEDPLYAVVPQLAAAASRAAAGGRVVTAPTFGKWGADLRAVVGDQPRLTLAGVATDCCVIATALPAADAGATITVVADACAGSTPAHHAQALGAMALFGPQVTIA